MRKWISFVVFVVLIWPLSAFAQNTYSFVYTCDACGFGSGTTLTWQMLASPTVTTYSTGNWFEVDGVNATEQGNSNPVSIDITFFKLTTSPSNPDSGFQITGGALADAYGPQLYTGPESAPTFNLSTGTGFQFTDFSNSNFPNGAPSSLSITCVECVPPVPEPESYAMLLAGLGLLGFMARRMKQKEATAA